MGRKAIISYVLILILDLLITSASCSRLAKSTQEQSQKDITNPITTVPTIIPAPIISSTSPVIIPTSNPDSILTPTVPINFTSPTPSLSSSWCIASPSSSQLALQVALDYACGYGGADCSDIQPSGKCYNPNSVRDHASYAFNQYYQKNPIPTSCNFAGTAVVTSTDPSSGSCQYQSTSTSSSILNATNSSGAPVFGAVPSPPITSAAARSTHIPPIYLVFLFLFLFSAQFRNRLF